MDFLIDRPEEVTGFELVLRRVAHGARLLGLGWWTALGVVTLVDGSPERPGWVIISLALAVVWALSASIVYRTDPSMVTSRLMVGVDLVLAVFSVFLAPALAGTDVSFYGGFPILVVVVAAIRGPRSAWLAAITLAVVTGGDLTVAAISSGDLAVPISQVLVYLAGAFIATWAVGVLRRSDAEIRAASEALARSRERTQISEHLHDSVLQTLALIQRASDRPNDVIGLARKQERELREWLYGPERAGQGGLADSIRAAAADVEERYGIPVEVVMVGDLESGALVEAIVGAVREATVNAAKHSGAPHVSLFVEVQGRSVTAYVRDRGKGFDPATIVGDRRGISDSIRARMARVGGSATVRSDDVRGTEWTMEAQV